MSPCPLENLLPGWHRQDTKDSVTFEAGDLRAILAADVAADPEQPWALIAGQILDAQHYGWTGDVRISVRREGAQVIVGARREVRDGR